MTRKFTYRMVGVLDEYLLFASRDEFRSWLQDSCLTGGGVWLLLGKSDGLKTIKADEALEEALCFGWIDGQMRSVDQKKLYKIFRGPQGKQQVVGEEQGVGRVT